MGFWDGNTSPLNFDFVPTEGVNPSIWDGGNLTDGNMPVCQSFIVNMAQFMQSSWHVLVIIIAVIALIIAKYPADKFRQKHPEYRGFYWGYFIAISQMLWGAFFLLLYLGIGICAHLFSAEAFNNILPLGIIWFVTGWMAYTRYRVGFILCTLCSFNPAWWIINLFYIRNRWKELKQLPKPQKFISISTRQQRIALISLVLAVAFLALQWFIYFWDRDFRWYNTDFWHDCITNRDYRAISRPLVFIGMVWGSVSLVLVIFLQPFHKGISRLMQWVNGDKN